MNGLLHAVKTKASTAALRGRRMLLILVMQDDSGVFKGDVLGLFHSSAFLTARNLAQKCRS